MPRFIIFLLAVCLIFGHAAQNKNFIAGQKITEKSVKLNGVYEFVSESKVLTKPDKITTERTSSEWSGLWQFKEGYYTVILMKKNRDSFFDLKDPRDTGYESFGGTYELEGQKIWFTQNIAFNPIYVGRSLNTEYKINKDKLILTQRLEPTVENLSKGTITTILKKVK